MVNDILLIRGSGRFEESLQGPLTFLQIFLRPLLCPSFLSDPVSEDSYTATASAFSTPDLLAFSSLLYHFICLLNLIVNPLPEVACPGDYKLQKAQVKETHSPYPAYGQWSEVLLLVFWSSAHLPGAPAPS